MPKQPPVGKNIALRFYNERANEPFEIFGVEMQVKAVGRR
jgi:hypothetical protein